MRSRGDVALGHYARWALTWRYEFVFFWFVVPAVDKKIAFPGCRPKLASAGDYRVQNEIYPRLGS
jgi:hypothetical protein